MFRRRLRPAYSDDQLAALYVEPHDHRAYGYGHGLRVEHTITLGQWLGDDQRVATIADLSCGNGEVANGIVANNRHVILGDFAPGYEHTGPLERTIDDIEHVDLFVCSETVEHLDDPESVLRQIHAKARCLLISTPIGEDDLGNAEHYWGWDQEAVESMLVGCGWKIRARVDLWLPDTYSYMILACVRNEP